MFGNLQADINRLFDSMFGRTASPASTGRAWTPLCDVWETSDEVAVALDVPGVGDKDANVTITGDVLTVRGERRNADTPEPVAWHRAERPHGRFERSFALPLPVHADGVKATCRDVLTIRLPKANGVKAK